MNPLTEEVVALLIRLLGRRLAGQGEELNQGEMEELQEFRSQFEPQQQAGCGCRDEREPRYHFDQFEEGYLRS